MPVLLACEGASHCSANQTTGLPLPLLLATPRKPVLSLSLPRQGTPKSSVLPGLNTLKPWEQFEDVLAAYRQHSKLWCPTLNKFAEGAPPLHNTPRPSDIAHA